MDDFCNCSQCPHHCGGDEEVDTPADGAETTSDSDKSDENKASSDDEDATASATEKVDHLKKDIIELGFKLEDTDDGIRVMM